MDDFPAHVLLREALTLLNDHSNFTLRTDLRATSYKLAGRINVYFARRAYDPKAITMARKLYAADGRVRLDLPPADSAELSPEPERRA